MPRMVSTERITFRRSARNAIRKVPRTPFIITSRSALPKLRNEWVLRAALRRLCALTGHHFLALAQRVGLDHRVRAVGCPRLHLDWTDKLALFQPDGAGTPLGSLVLLGFGAGSGSIRLRISRFPPPRLR